MAIMRGILTFLRATLVGGLLFLTPLVVLVVVINKALTFGARLIRPLADRVPYSLGLGPAKAYVAAGLLLVLICFLAGLLARSALARKSVQMIEGSVLSFIPGYEYLKQAGASVLGAMETDAQPVVLVRIGDSWRIGVKTEEIGEKWLSIFVPNSPNSNRGNVFIVDRAKVRVSATPLATALASLRRCGAGAGWVAETIDGAEDPPVRR
jgi:uncharacterized membrane protein